MNPFQTKHILLTNSVSFIQSFFLCYVFGRYQKMTQELEENVKILEVCHPL